jgi:hypothetical protein
MRASDWRELLNHEAKRTKQLVDLVAEVNELGAELMDMAEEKERQYNRAQQAEAWAVALKEERARAGARADINLTRAETAEARVAQLCWQRDDLQARNTELVQERRAIKQQRDAMARVVYDAIRFARHFPDCQQYPCTCDYVDWRDKRDEVMAEL